MQNVITYVRRNDLAEPIKRVALERNRNRSTDHTPFSIYRDILFLAFIVLGRGNIDQGKFFHMSRMIFFFFFFFFESCENFTMC
jgi:hypothetical protein